MRMTETAHDHRAQTPEEVTHDLLSRLPVSGGGLIAIVVLAILALAGRYGADSRLDRPGRQF